MNKCYTSNDAGEKGKKYEYNMKKATLVGLFRCHGSSNTLTIGATSKVNKEVSKRKKVANIKRNSKALTRSIHTRRNREIADSKRHANNKLADLDGSKVSFAWGMKTDTSGSIVAVHDGVNKGVEQDKDPNWCCTIANTRPHR